MRRTTAAFTLALLVGAASAHGQDAEVDRSADETCSDGVHNGPEADTDCGGDCRACGFGRVCTGASDCASGLCVSGECAEREHRRGVAVPAGYDTAVSRHDGAASLRLAGALFFGLSYGAAYAGAVSAPRYLGELYVPVLGPWLGLDEVEHPAGKTLLVADAAAQAAGAILLIAGVVGAGAQLVREPPGEIPQARAPRRPRPPARVAVRAEPFSLSVRF